MKKNLHKGAINFVDFLAEEMKDPEFKRLWDLYIPEFERELQEELKKDAARKEKRRLAKQAK